MTTDEIINTINHFVPFSEDDLINDNESFLSALMSDLESKNDFIRGIEPIINLIEKFPHSNFGNPGPLVHTLEAHQDLYEEYLKNSLNRKPVPLTVWMLNRIINSEKNILVKENLFDILQSLTNHPNIDTETLKTVENFIDFQNQQKLS